MDNFTINKAHNFVVRKLPVQLPDMNKYRLFEFDLAEVTQVKSDYADLLFQQLPTKVGDIWLGHYNTLKDANFYATSTSQALELQFMLHDDARYNLTGHGDIHQKQGYFNLSYVPSVENQFFLPKGKQIFTFDIHFKKEVLRDLIIYFPELDSFLNNVEKHQPALLWKEGIKANPDIMTRVWSLLSNKIRLREEESSWYISRDIEMLLFACLKFSNYQHANLVKATPYDLERLEALHNYILQFPDHEYSLEQLAKMFYINDFKMKMFFRERYGYTIERFRMKVRMEKTILLLTTTKKPITEIAYIVGFKNIRSFFNQLNGFMVLVRYNTEDIFELLQKL